MGCKRGRDMDIASALRPCSRSPSPLLSEESAVNYDFSANHRRRSRPGSHSMQPVASGSQHSERGAACFHWPPSSRLHNTAEDRATYFNNLQKDVDSGTEECVPAGHQATTILDLMTIRAFRSKTLRRFSLGTAIGFRIRQGVLTTIPAIIVFVSRKVHREWLHQIQKLPSYLEGPGGIWCDVDVMEFPYHGSPVVTSEEQFNTEIVEGLRGNDHYIGPGSQVASYETYGTLGAIVQSRIGSHQVGFLTNRHVAINLDYPNQKMFHPLPPNLGPGVYLGEVERATSFITDDMWYEIFASMIPETFVQVDAAFIPFGDSFDLLKVTTSVKGVGNMGDVMDINLLDPIGSIVGRQVIKVGRSSGLTKGRIIAYALEYNDERGIYFFTDFVIVGENNQPFDFEGDRGSLILMIGEKVDKPRPVGIICGGSANRRHLKLQNGHGPEKWTSGVDLGRLLGLLQLNLITSDTALANAIEEQRRWTSLLVAVSDIGESSPMLLGMDRQRSGDVSQPERLEGISNSDLQTQFQEKNWEREQGTDITHHSVPISIAKPSAATTMEVKFIKEFDIGVSPFDRNKEAEKIDASNLKDSNAKELSFGLYLSDKEEKSKPPFQDN